MEKSNSVTNIANMKHSNLYRKEKRKRNYRKTTLERIGNNRFYNEWVNKNKYAIIDSNGKILEKFRIKASAFHVMHDIQNYPGELEVVDLDWNEKVITQKRLT